MRRGLRKASRYAKGLPMLELVEVDERNWLDVRELSVAESQEGFLDSALGIIAKAVALDIIINPVSTVAIFAFMKIPPRFKLR